MAASTSKVPQLDEVRTDSGNTSPENKEIRMSKGKLFCPIPKGKDPFLVDPVNPTFELLRQRVFVDKTMLVNIILRNEKPYRVILPRAMGKTLVLKMVESFCDVEPVPGIPTRPNKAARNQIWAGTEIKIREPEFFDSHFGQHPVIYFTLRDVEGDTLESVLDKFRMQLCKCCEKFRYIYDKLKNKKNDAYYQYHLNFLDKVLNGGGKDLSEVDLCTSLDTLAEIVNEFHGNTKTILLLDDYDKPISALFSRQIEENQISKIAHFQHLLMLTTCKSNPYINVAILAGNLQISLCDSGLLFCECNLLQTSDLNEFFGFTIEDIEEMVEEIKQECGFDIPNEIQTSLIEWCNGYTYTNRYNGIKYNLCNPYACCKFLNEYIKFRENNMNLPNLFRVHLKIDTLGENLKTLLQDKEISKIVMDILLFENQKEKQRQRQRKLMCLNIFGKKKKEARKPQFSYMTTNLNQTFDSYDLKIFNEAMRNKKSKYDENFLSILFAYLSQMGILTQRNWRLVVRNQQIRDQLNKLLMQC